MRMKADGLLAATLCMTLAWAGSVEAQISPSRDSRGLVGGERVGWVDDGGTDLVVHGRAAYGLIEEADGEGGAHHRMEGQLGLAVRPLEFLSFALGMHGRFDLHPDDDQGADDSGFGMPYLAARAGTLFGDLGLGLDIHWSLIGADAPSIDFGASRLDTRLLLSYRLSQLTLALNAGFRLDGSAKVAELPQTVYRSGDAVSLGLNDHNALLFGLAASYAIGQSDVYLEATFEPYVGSGAPSISKAPFRIGAGFRTMVTDGLGIHAGLEARIQSRAPVDLTVLRAVEPRIRVYAGISYAFDLSPTPEGERSDLDPDEETPETEENPEPSIQTLRGVVRGPDGVVAEATIRFLDEDGNVLAEVQSDANGAYEIALPADQSGIRVEVSREGFEPYEADAGDEAMEVALTAVAPEGALRGLVRDYAGRPLTATVRVGDTEATTDEDGAFELTLEPGRHEVTIEAQGFRTQNRNVEVDLGGVTVINVDMRRGR